MLSLYMEQYNDNKTLYIWFFLALIIIIVSVFLQTTPYLSVVSVFILAYVVYLNIQQTQVLQRAKMEAEDRIRTQIDMNIVYSYFFTFSLGLLILFVIRNMMSTSTGLL